MTNYAPHKDFAQTDIPEHVHTPDCWISDPKCAEYHIMKLRFENAELVGRQNLLMQKLAGMALTIRKIKAQLDQLNNGIEREIRK